MSKIRATYQTECKINLPNSVAVTVFPKGGGSIGQVAFVIDGPDYECTLIDLDTIIARLKDERESIRNAIERQRRETLP